MQKATVAPTVTQNSSALSSLVPATNQPKKNIISVVFHPEKIPQRETKSMFETVKKSSSQEKKSIKSAKPEDNYDGDDELDNDSENKQRVKKETKVNPQPSKSAFQQPPAAKDTPKPENTEAARESELQSPITTDSTPSNTIAGDQKSTKEPSKVEETVERKPRTLKQNTTKEPNTSDDSKSSKPKEVKKLEVKISEDPAKESTLPSNSNSITNAKKDSPKETQSLFFSNTSKAQSPGKMVDSTKSANSSLVVLKKESTRSSKVRQTAKDHESKTSKSTTGGNQLHRTKHSGNSFQGGRNQAGTNFIVANKLLVQTLARMNAEKRVKNLQSRFYDNSISPSQLAEQVINRKKESIHQTEGQK